MNYFDYDADGVWDAEETVRRMAAEARARFEQEQQKQYQAQYDALLNAKVEWVTDKMPPPVILPHRKRPAELDDKDRKSPWGHIPFHG